MVKNDDDDDENISGDGVFFPVSETHLQSFLHVSTKNTFVYGPSLDRREWL